jgi:hypothetical protein
MLPTQWRCRFCKTWNKWVHRYCSQCLAQKAHMTLTEDDTR